VALACRGAMSAQSKGLAVTKSGAQVQPLPQVGNHL